MNTLTRSPIVCGLFSRAVVLAGTLALATAAVAGVTNTPAKPLEVAKSAFVMPRNKNEGRDPFFPNSARAYEGAAPKNGSRTVVGAGDLQLRAIGGPESGRICTINNRTFSKGEDGEMTTSAGRIQIHIVDILEDSVIVTVNGEQRELRFRRQFK